VQARHGEAVNGVPERIAWKSGRCMAGTCQFRVEPRESITLVPMLSVGIWTGVFSCAGTHLGLFAIAVHDRSTIVSVHNPFAKGPYGAACPSGFIFRLDFQGWKRSCLNRTRSHYMN